MPHAFRILLIAAILLPASNASAQLAPTMGYMFPSGGKAGKTIDVTLGGYDWTPDMQLLVHDERIKLELLSPPGPVIVPEPPYWFGKKARRPPFLLPREMKARLTIPVDMPPGFVSWQAANANGATAVGRFVVDDLTQYVDNGDRQQPQTLPSLPVTISGQIKHIEEVDRYQFTAAKTGPLTVSLVARGIGSDLNAAIEVVDDAGRLIADAADTAGADNAFTFAAEAKRQYTVSLYDVDFRGNRAFVYRLSLRETPHVVTAIPAFGRRGETRSVEFVGYGVASGAAKLESVKRDVVFPDDAKADSFLYQLKTPHGDAEPFALHLSDRDETLEPGENARQLTLPASLTGVLDEPYGEDRYRVTASKGSAISLELAAAKIGSPLDVALAIYDAEGAELARSDDLPGTTDAALEYTFRADGDYQIVVSDVSGRSGNRAATYHLVAQEAEPGFDLIVPELLNLPIAGKVSLPLKATRAGGFKDPIAVTVSGLPEGVTVPPDLSIPAGKPALSIELTASENTATGAAMIRVTGKAMPAEQTGKTPAKAEPTEPAAPPPPDRMSSPILLAVIITPPFSIDAEGKDDVTKWPRGTTFPGPVLIERNEGFREEIVLEMTSKQGRHRQGIRGPELTVPPNVNRILYPVFLPEWLETTRTSRMVVNGVAKVKDPLGNVRYSVVKQKTRMGFLPTGALLKLSADETEFSVKPGDTLSVPLTVSRNEKLTEPVALELIVDEVESFPFTAQRQLKPAGEDAHFAFPIVLAESAAPRDYELTIRATVMQDGKLPVVSETQFVVRVK